MWTDKAYEVLIASILIIVAVAIICIFEVRSVAIENLRTKHLKGGCEYVQNEQSHHYENCTFIPERDLAIIETE